MKDRQNEEVRRYAETRGVRLYQIAFAMGRSYDWLMRKVRLPMSDEETKVLIQTIDEIVRERESA